MASKDIEPNSPTDLSPPVGSILESIWIDVVPNGGDIEKSHRVASKDIEPNSPTDLSPPVGSLLESIWIDVVPNGGDIENSHRMASEDTEPRIETPPGEEMLTDEIISDEEMVMTLDRDSGGEVGEEVKEVDEEDEEDRTGTIQVKDTYVALRKLKIRGWKIRVKTSTKKRKQRWMFEKDRDWKPPRSKRKKVKVTPKIKLIRRRPISEDEEQTEPSYRRSRLKRIWRGTNLKHQSEVITFYQTMHKKRIKAGKKIQRNRRREEEQGAYGGFVTITVPMTDRAGRSPTSGRQDCRRKSDTEVWEAELRGGQVNGSEQREGLEVNLETTQDKEQEVCNMEARGLVQDSVGVNHEVVMGQDLEEKSGTKQSPSTKEGIDRRREEGAQEEEVPEREAAEADSVREGSGEGESSRRDGRATEEGEVVEEAEANERPRPEIAIATVGAGNATAPVVGIHDLLRKWIEDGTPGLACEDRVRSAEPPPRPRDQEMSRGKSMR